MESYPRISVTPVTPNTMIDESRILAPATRFLMARLRGDGIAVDVVNDGIQAAVVQQSEKLTAFDVNALQDAFKVVCFE